MPVLDGIRVIDASRILAGPHCGQMLADNGAEVIKVEAIEGDQNRKWPPIADGAGVSFLSVNRGKQGISLNLKHPKGQELLRKLVATADIYIQNFLPSVTSRLGTDYETLNRVNPDLIYVSITGFGTRGPMRDHPGFGAMAAAFSGIMHMTGEPDGPPLNPGIPVADMATSILAYAGAVTALVARMSGKARGQRVDVSLLETSVAMLAPTAMNWMIAGQQPHREGAFNTKLAPYGPYHCKDGDIMIGVTNDGVWRKFCQGIGAAALANDPRFTTNELRCDNRTELRKRLEAVLEQATIEQWFGRLAETGVACSPINTVEGVCSHEQVLANDMIIRVPRRDGGTMPLIGLPLKLSATPGEPGKAPPSLGEDTDGVLQRILALDNDALATLHREGVI